MTTTAQLQLRPFRTRTFRKSESEAHLRDKRLPVRLRFDSRQEEVERGLLELERLLSLLGRAVTVRTRH